MVAVWPLLLFLVCVHAKRERAKTHRVAQLEYAQPCEKPQSSLSCYRISKNMNERGGVSVDADCYLGKGAVTMNKVTINLTMCIEVVSANTCEYFQTWTFSSNVCPLIVEPKAPWASFVQSVTPPLKCPLRPGNMSCRGAYVDPDKVALLPMTIDNKIFIIMINAFNQDLELVACIEAAVRFKRVRS